MGLMDTDPEQIDPQAIPDLLANIKENGHLAVSDCHDVPFDPEADIAYRREETRPYHANAMTLRGRFEDGEMVEETYYSIGGGFIVKEGEEEASSEQENINVPYPASTGEALLVNCQRNGWSVSELAHGNEQAWHDDAFIDERLDAIWDAMKTCVYRGCHAEQDELPGGLAVQRRAGRLYRKLLGRAGKEAEVDDEHTPGEWVEVIRKMASSRRTEGDFQDVVTWISCFALATNEENATFGRVVTAPTNGAAGVIPAVLLYYLCFCNGTEEGRRDFLLTAGQIGILFKQRATISAAMGGCQAEIGVSSAMASAGLTECLGGDVEQVLMAAEIAMEHHLGMTCDPVGGLVQVPCIERNSMGAVKAITASSLALESDPGLARVSLDEVIETMWETAQDMNSKYKETSEGGLAARIPVNITEC